MFLIKSLSRSHSKTKRSSVRYTKAESDHMEPQESVPAPWVVHVKKILIVDSIFNYFSVAYNAGKKVIRVSVASPGLKSLSVISSYILL